MIGYVPLVPSVRRRTLRIARGAAFFAILMGGLVLLGWFFDVPGLKSLLPGLSTMEANTAVGFLLGGGALLLLADPSWVPSLRQRRIGVGLAGLTTLLGAITLAEYGLGWNPGLDEILFRDPVPALFPGRMAPATALCFTLLGVGLGGIGLRPRRPIHPLVPGLLATLIASLSGLALFGYFTGISDAYGWGPLTSMALPTAACFLILSASLVSLAHAEHPEISLRPLAVVVRRSAHRAAAEPADAREPG